MCLCVYVCGEKELYIYTHIEREREFILGNNLTRLWELTRLKSLGQVGRPETPGRCCIVSLKGVCFLDSTPLCTCRHWCEVLCYALSSGGNFTFARRWDWTGGQVVSSRRSTSKISAPPCEGSTTQGLLRLTSTLALKFSNSSLLFLPHHLDITTLASRLHPASSLGPSPPPSLHIDTIGTLTPHS